MIVKYFKAKKTTHGIRKNQKVWIIHDYANHAEIRHRWRGKGRYVKAIVAKWSEDGQTWNPLIGDEGFISIEIDDIDALRLIGNKEKLQGKKKDTIKQLISMYTQIKDCFIDLVGGYFKTKN